METTETITVTRFKETETQERTEHFGFEDEDGNNVFFERYQTGWLLIQENENDILLSPESIQALKDFIETSDL